MLTGYFFLLAKPSPQFIEFERDDVFPLIIDQSTPYNNKLIVHGVAPMLKMEVTSDHKVAIYVDDKLQKCKSAADCVFVVKTDQKTIEINIFAEQKTKLSAIEYSVAKYRNKTTLSNITSESLAYTIFGVLFLILFCGIFQSNDFLTQWVVVVFTMAFFCLTDLAFSLAFLGYLYLLYKLRHKISGKKGGALRLLPFVISAIAFLFLFKYCKGFLFEIFANPGDFNLAMPLGVSYFAMRIIDTQLRWYRGQHLEMSFREIIFFIIFPGTLIAGPIENINDFYKNRISRIGREDYAYGVSRILIGAFKKVVIADGFLGVDYKAIYPLIIDPASASGGEIFAFAIGRMLFAYIDFSAYSDIAIGLSRLFGYRIRENFNFPVFAENIREYWKRWHMSLSEWAFRNIYFPLLITTRNSYIPLFVTMMTIGFWHAFNLSWFSWALHHASGMSAVALMKKYVPCNPRLLLWLKPLRIMVTLVFVSMGFIFVYFNDYSIALTLYIKSWKSLLFLES